MNELEQLRQEAEHLKTVIKEGRKAACDTTLAQATGSMEPIGRQHATLLWPRPRAAWNPSEGSMRHYFGPGHGQHGTHRKAACDTTLAQATGSMEPIGRQHATLLWPRPR